MQERGWGSLNSDEGHTLWYSNIYVLCGPNSPGLNPGILSGTRGAADEAVLNKVLKNTHLKIFQRLCSASSVAKTKIIEPLSPLTSMLSLYYGLHWCWGGGGRGGGRGNTLRAESHITKPCGAVLI